MLTLQHQWLYVPVVEQGYHPVAALRQALAEAGSQAELARTAGVSQQAVSKWVRQAKQLPAAYVLKVEAATGVSRHDLRPDLYPLPVGMPPAVQHSLNLHSPRGAVAFNSTPALPPEPAND